MIRGDDVIDLTHRIEEGMPVFPGTEPPRLRQANTLEKDGFREKLISMYSHTGTHMDAPAHILEGAPELDTFPVGHFLGRGVVIDIGERKGSGNTVGAEVFQRYEVALSKADYLIIRSGWERYWGSERYFEDFPVLSPDAAVYLAGCGLKGIATDSISVDPTEDTRLPIHRILLGAGMVIIENLANSGELPSLNDTAGSDRDSFFFGAIPLRIRDSDGSPVRAFAQLRVE